MMHVHVDDLVKHAEKFGTDCVMETALELGAGFAQLVQLRRRLDVIEKNAAAQKRFSNYKKPRLSVERRVQRLMGEEVNDGTDEDQP